MTNGLLSVDFLPLSEEEEALRTYFNNCNNIWCGIPLILNSILRYSNNSNNSNNILDILTEDIIKKMRHNVNQILSYMDPFETLLEYVYNSLSRKEIDFEFISMFTRNILLCWEWTLFIVINDKNFHCDTNKGNRIEFDFNFNQPTLCDVFTEIQRVWCILMVFSEFDKSELRVEGKYGFPETISLN
jgi:hypothetical protein